MVNVGFYGLGAFGFAMMKYLDGQKTCNILGFDVNNEVLACISKRKCHPYFHDCEFVSSKVKVVPSANDLIEQSDIIVLAVSSKAINDVIHNFKNKKNKIILNLTKGFDEITGKTVSQKIDSLLDKNNISYAVLAGGTIAKDLLNEQPIGMTLGSRDLETLKLVKKVFSSTKLRIYPTTDVLGVEFASSYKNVVSIFSGILTGMDYQLSTITYMITKASEEMKNLAIGKGANPKTFSMNSQCWGNDLWMSCLGKTRNFNFGVLIGQGGNVQETINEYNEKRLLLEGITTLKTIEKHEKTTNYPILQATIKIVLDGQDAIKTINKLMKTDF